MIPTFRFPGWRHRGSFVTDLDTCTLQRPRNAVMFERESPFVCIEQTPGVLR